MTKGEIYRFRDDAFANSDLRRMNGLTFMVLSQVPDDCPLGVDAYGVKILVDGQVSEWSKNALSCYAEVVDG